MLKLITLWISKSQFGQLISRAIPKNKKAPKAATPPPADTLWSIRKDWAKGEIVSGDKSNLVTTWVTALLLNGFCWQIWIIVLQKVSIADPAAWFALAFCGAGLIMLTRAVRQSIRYKKFGTSTFKMLSVPGQIGGSLAGVIEVGGKLYPKEGFSLSLSCLQRTTTGTGKERRVEESVIWEEKKIVNQMQELNLHRSGIPVHFEIPTHCSATSNYQGVSWHLQAKAAVPGVDFTAKFEVPIFKTSTHVSKQILPAEFSARYEMPLEITKKLAVVGINVRSTSEGEEFEFGAGRSKGIGILAFLFLLLSATGLVFVITNGASATFMAVTVVATGALGWACIELWLKSMRIVANPEGLTIHTRYPGRRKRAQIPAIKILSIETKLDSQAGEVIYYHIRACTADKNFHVGGWIKGKKEADWIVNEMYSALKLRNHEESQTTQE